MSGKKSTSTQILEELTTLKTIIVNMEAKLEELTEKVDSLSESSKANIKIPKKKSSPKKSSIPKSGSVTVNKYNDAILVTGQTYDKRIVLKKYKALWNKEKKGWSVKMDKYDDLVSDLENCCNKVDRRSIDEYFFEEKTSMASMNSGDDHSVDSNFNPNAQYAFLDEDD